MRPVSPLPSSLLEGLARMPPERPVALLLRHAARPPIPPGEWGDALALTDEGALLARRLGEHLGARLVALHTSPVARCVQTARLLGEGCRSAPGLQLLARSGHVPGLHVFVTHDSLLAPTIARVLHHPRLRAHWPGFLEAAFFWREGNDTRGAYRAHEARLSGR